VANLSALLAATALVAVGTSTRSTDPEASLSTTRPAGQSLVTTTEPGVPTSTSSPGPIVTPTTTLPTAATTSTAPGSPESTTSASTKPLGDRRYPGNEPSACIRSSTYGAIVAVASTGRLWAVMDGSIGVSEDDGRTWRWGCNAAPYGTTRLIAVDDNSAWAISGGLPSSVPDRTPVISLVRTDDAGRTWRSAKLPFENVTDAEFIGRDRGWVIGSSTGRQRLVRTTDGDTWKELDFPFDPEGGFGTSISFSDAEHGWMSHGNPARLFRTRDGGLSWTRVNFPDQLSVYDLISPSPETVVIGTGHFYQSGRTPEPHDDEGLVFATSDGGTSWSRTSFGNGVLVCCNNALAAVSPTEIAAVDGEGVTVTTDGGRSWGTTRTSDTDGFPNQVVAGTERRFFVPMSERGLVQIGSDGGRTWRTVQLPYREDQPG
jgi:photosystem II stability/assembly factor-like uncharacterized protein